LPESWTVDNLLKRHRSRPYNPKIAYVFYRAGYIETWGRGIERITTACKDAGKREPLFEVSPGENSVTFFCDSNVVEKSADVVENVVEKSADVVENVLEKSAGVADHVVENDVQRLIIRLMTENSTISSKTLADMVGMTPRSVQRAIDSLKKRGVVERVGPAKGGHWAVRSPW
jgi:ATP-dependent DNA helicase RecG